jgi:hypothetical protein
MAMAASSNDGGPTMSMTVVMIAVVLANAILATENV